MGHETEYLEVQMYGKLGVEDIKSIIVETEEEAARILKELRRKGLEHIEIRLAGYDTRLKGLLENSGSWDRMSSINSNDIELLGVRYHDAILRYQEAGSLIGDGVKKEYQKILNETIRKYKDAKEYIKKGTAAEKKA